MTPKVKIGRYYRAPTANMHSAEDDMWQRVLLGIHRPPILQRMQDTFWRWPGGITASIFTALCLLSTTLK